MSGVDEMLAARESSIKEGLGHGVRPRQLFAVEYLIRPEASERPKRWVYTSPTKAKAKAMVEAFNKYPAPHQEVRLLQGSITWEEVEV